MLGVHDGPVTRTACTVAWPCAMTEATPTFSFGVIADPQYGDLPDGNVEGRCQRYREVPGKLEEAVAAFVKHHKDLQGVLVLGDFINGRDDEATSKAELELLATITDGLGDLPCWHVMGNHDIGFVSREDWMARLKVTGSSYRSQPLAPGWRLVVLDTCELSLKSGLAEDSSAMVEAKAYWEAHPISDEEPNMYDWNGGLSSQQYSWLEAELAAAERAGDKVIVASHHPIGELSARSTHMAWDWKRLQRILVGSGCVVLALAGHDHMGGHHQHGNTHFVTVQAMLEAPEGSNAYAQIQVFPNHLEIKGTGTVTSRKLAIASGNSK